MSTKVKEAKWHNRDESRLMARANGYVMVRRPGCAPYILDAKTWDALPDAAEGRRARDEAMAAAKSPVRTKEGMGL